MNSTSSACAEMDFVQDQATSAGATSGDSTTSTSESIPQMANDLQVMANDLQVMMANDLQVMMANDLQVMANDLQVMASDLQVMAATEATKSTYTLAAEKQQIERRATVKATADWKGIPLETKQHIPSIGGSNSLQKASRRRKSAARSALNVAFDDDVLNEDNDGETANASNQSLDQRYGLFGDLEYWKAFSQGASCPHNFDTNDPELLRRVRNGYAVSHVNEICEGPPDDILKTTWVHMRQAGSSGIRECAAFDYWESRETSGLNDMHKPVRPSMDERLTAWKIQAEEQQAQDQAEEQAALKRERKETASAFIRFLRSKGMTNEKISHLF